MKMRIIVFFTIYMVMSCFVVVAEGNSKSIIKAQIDRNGILDLEWEKDPQADSYHINIFDNNCPECGSKYIEEDAFFTNKAEIAVPTSINSILIVITSHDSNDYLLDTQYETYELDNPVYIPRNNDLIDGSYTPIVKSIEKDGKYFQIKWSYDEGWIGKNPYNTLEIIQTKCLAEKCEIFTKTIENPSNTIQIEPKFEKEEFYIYLRGQFKDGSQTWPSNFTFIENQDKKGVENANLNINYDAIYLVSIVIGVVLVTASIIHLRKREKHK